MSVPRKVFVFVTCLGIAIGFYVLATGRLVINASDSLHGNAYAMFSWPKFAPRGSIVAMKLPPVLREKLGDDDLVLTKRVAGVAGDIVKSDEQRLCVNDRCAPAHVKNGKQVAPIWQGGRVPEDSILVLGDSKDSLDSRYAVIGPRPLDDVIAVGFEIPFPHWTKLGEWLQ